LRIVGGRPGCDARCEPGRQPDDGDPVLRAVAYLQSQQAADGGFLGFSGTGDPGVTADAVLALVAAGKAGVPVDVSAAVAFLTANGEAYALTGAGQAAKLVLALSAAGANPRDVGDSTRSRRSSPARTRTAASTARASTTTASRCCRWCRPANPSRTRSRRSRRFAPGRSGRVVVLRRDGDGRGWRLQHDRDCIQALVAAGLAEDDMVQGGVDYLRSIQLPQGFPFQPGSGAVADANSTGIVVQALIAVGEDPSSEAWQNVGGSLLLFQNPSGAFRYTMEPPDDNLFATLQALPAIAGQAYPIAAGNGTPAALPEPQGTCTPEQLAATPGADAELPCAA
jgi:hypothetical protein